MGVEFVWLNRHRVCLFFHQPPTGSPLTFSGIPSALLTLRDVLGGIPGQDLTSPFGKTGVPSRREYVGRSEEAGWRPTSQTPKWHGSRNSLSGCGMGIIQIKTREGFGFVARAGHERSGLTRKGGWLVEWSPHSQTSGRGGRAFDELQDIQELWPFRKSPTALGAHQIRPAN